MKQQQELLLCEYGHGVICCALPVEFCILKGCIEVKDSNSVGGSLGGCWFYRSIIPDQTII